jgi:ribonuclease HII
MKWVVGIDEVGRGALAGPVVVAAAMIAVDKTGQPKHIPFLGLKDSKKLSAHARVKWVNYFKSQANVRFALARVYPRGIERLNISAAANRAALKALSQLSKKYDFPASTPIILDGGLFLGSKTMQKGHKNAITVVKGDKKFPAVAAASIIAKVSRDRFMVRLSKKYPAYGFEVHKGYGTTVHRRAIKKAGACEAHRLTFLRLAPIIKG